METRHRTHHQQAAATSRLGMRNGGGGEIVEVQGGHIVRSTGRKDRHSKVCTAKGPRDRRVRLSAPTAIQFYDVQDRLGYDRPSKAVDWLITKAKAAIDELAELPAWKPSSESMTTTTTFTATTLARAGTVNQQQRDTIRDERDFEFPIEEIGTHSTRNGTTPSEITATATAFVVGSGGDVRTLPVNDNESFLPPSLESDSVAHTIMSFPLDASAETTSSSIQLQGCPPDLLSRTSSHGQDLQLSLQSFREPLLLHAHQEQRNNNQNKEQLLFSGTNRHENHHHQHDLGFDGSSAGWAEHRQNHSTDIDRFQRMVAWNVSGADTGSVDGGGCVGGVGFLHNPATLPTVAPQLPLHGQNQFFSQRGPLQSSYTPVIRAWMDPVITDNNHQFIPTIHHQSAYSGFGGSFSGYCIPTQIQGEEEHDGIDNKPSSASSESHH